MKKTETNQVNETEFTVNPEEELAALKVKADLLGVKYRANVSIEVLREKILDKQEEDAAKGSADVPEDAAQVVNSERAAIRAEALKLVRVRISNLNPKKSQQQGEIITVSNRYVGTVKKYVPYGAGSVNGYHLPQIILEQLKSRRFDNSTYDQVSKSVKFSWAPEFAIEVLPPLTEKELKALAVAQAARNGIDSEEE